MTIPQLLHQSRFTVQHPTIKSYLIHTFDYGYNFLTLTQWIPRSTKLRDVVPDSVDEITIVFLDNFGTIIDLVEFVECEINNFGIKGSIESATAANSPLQLWIEYNVSIIRYPSS